jgi:prephenate dehydrogenase
MKIGIIGLGLIGGTIAQSLNEKYEIEAFDINHKALEYAIENKIIGKAYTNLKDFLDNNQVIYLCLYPKDIISFFNTHKNIIGKNTVFIEISGIKSQIMKDIENLNLLGFEIVFTHPIAGREYSGVEFSNKSIFNNGNYAIIDDADNKKESLDLAYKLAKDMGFKNISLISRQLHDEVIAYTSQLTHIISLALVNSFHQDVNLNHYTGDSYRDLTRIANINTELWSDLFLHNKEYLVNQIIAFENSLSALKNALLDNDINKLKELMNEARVLHQKYLEGNK